jgi:hypothetical protein
VNRCSCDGDRGYCLPNWQLRKSMSSFNPLRDCAMRELSNLNHALLPPVEIALLSRSYGLNASSAFTISSIAAGEARDGVRAAVALHPFFSGTSPFKDAATFARRAKFVLTSHSVERSIYVDQTRLRGRGAPAVVAKTI